MKNKTNTKEKAKVTYTREMLIKSIIEECGRKFGNIRNKEKKELDILRAGEESNIVRSIYGILERRIEELLSSADANTDISIRLFEGISIDSTFIPEKTKLNNLTGEVITAAKKIRPKANITRNYREKLTENHK